MKLFFLLLFSLLQASAFGASCCVSNTSVPNLMILPSKWQHTLSLNHAKVIGDVSPKGKSVFRNSSNKEQTVIGRLDVAYGWNFRYQTGVSVRYQNKEREFQGARASDSGWSDVGLSHAYMPKTFDRLWIYQTVNLPTAKSLYDANSSLSVDAQGSGTYLTSVGVFKIHNFKEGDITFGSEVHHSFGRNFKNGSNDLEVDPFWGGSLSVGGGYVPWKSKWRWGGVVTPRMEGAKTTRSNGGSSVKGKQSLVWDTVFNATYSFDAQYALGLTYLNQSLLGPARNTQLIRSWGLLFQARY